MVARKTSTAPTRIWKFGARVANERAIADILRTANRYYNRLVEIERARNASYSMARREHAPVLAALEDQWEGYEVAIEAAFEATKSERARHYRGTGEKMRTAPPEVDALRLRQRELSAQAKLLRVEFSARLAPAQAESRRRSLEYAGGGGPRAKGQANARTLAEMLGESQWDPAWLSIARSDAVAHGESIAARAACGLPSGTYLQIEEAFQRARKDSLPRAPRFRRWDGGGKLSVQLRDVTFAEMSQSQRCSIHQSPHDPGRKGDQSRMFMLRMDQSIPRGDKQTIEATVKMHRIPPADASVKWAHIVVRRVGSRTTYELQLTLEHDSFAEPKRPAGMRAPEHVRVGWARVESGVRVASWSDGDVVLPTNILAQHETAAHVQGAGDHLFDRAKRLLARWMARGDNRLTAWHRMRNDFARRTLRVWCKDFADAESQGSAHAVWVAWKRDRLARGEDLYAPAWLVRRWLVGRGVREQSAHVAFWLYVWARKDEHMCQLAVDSLRRFAHRRDAHYRAEAIRLSTEFRELYVDAYKIAALRVLPEITLPGDGVRDQAQHQAHAAAPGRFREILIEVMGSRVTPRERSGDAPKTRRKTSAKTATEASAK